MVLSKLRLPQSTARKTAVSPPHPSPLPAITTRYIVALATIAFLAILGQILIQFELNRQTGDSLVVNIAGRQRMLSQRLSKSALAIAQAPDTAAQQFWLNELATVTNQWTSAHSGLKFGGEIQIDALDAGGRTLVLPDKNSEIVQALFTEIDPAHQTMVNAANMILANPNDYAVIETAVSTILAHEPTFLAGMEQIVFQYDAEAAARVQLLRHLELILLGITLLVLFLEGMFIFRPAVAHIRRTVTQLTNISNTLKFNEERYRSLVESSHDLIFSVTKDGRFTYTNQSCLTTLEYTPQELSNLTVRDIMAPVQRTMNMLLFRRVLHGRLYEDIQTTFRTKTGGHILVEGAFAPTFLDGEVVAVQGLFHNITRRQQAEQGLRTSNKQLEHLSRRLMHIQEEERRHLARELHDEIGQRLTAIKMQLQTAVNLPQHDTANQYIHNSIPILEETLQQVRSLSLDLRPSLLDDMGLVVTLRWYLDKQAQWAGFDVQFNTNLETRLSPTTEIVCFRVVQESITNIMRHAHAKNVAVELMHHTTYTTLTIQDDGIGFDVEQGKQKNSTGASLGLRGMEERMMLVNGRLDINSTPGIGTCIRLTIGSKHK